MLNIQKIQHVTHAVADRRKAAAFSEGVLGAAVVFRGRMETSGREASLAAVGSLCSELIDPPEGLSDEGKEYIDRYGGLLYSVTFRVDSVEAAAEHVACHGVEPQARRPRYFRTDAGQSHGLLMEFTDEDLPCPTPVSTTPVRPLEPALMGTVSALVDDLERASRFLEEALCAELAGARAIGLHTEASRFYALGESRLSIMTPKAGDTVLSSVMDRQGGAGLHGVCIIVDDLEAAGQHLRSHGIGLMGTKDVRLTTHPRSAFGARILFMPPPGPDDPRFNSLELSLGKDS